VCIQDGGRYHHLGFCHCAILEKTLEYIIVGNCYCYLSSTEKINRAVVQKLQYTFEIQDGGCRLYIRITEAMP
jgi:hypothetical protein